MKLLLLVIGCLLLGGCAGGGGSPPVVVPPIVMRPDLLFGYFGIAGAQIAQTAASVNVLWLDGWGNWATEQKDIADRITQQIKDGVAAGVTKMILFVDFLIWTPTYQYKGTADAITFVNTLKAAGLWQYIIGLYPLDEPDVAGVPNATMLTALTDLKAAFNLPLAVTYGTKGTPGLAGYDWIGKDDYGAGAGVLNEMPPLTGNQKWMLVPGGADPWKQDPAAFANFANANPNVVGIMPFLWADYAGGQGIGSNGMAPKYIALGTLIGKA